MYQNDVHLFSLVATCPMFDDVDPGPEPEDSIGDICRAMMEAARKIRPSGRYVSTFCLGVILSLFMFAGIIILGTTDHQALGWGMIIEGAGSIILASLFSDI